MDVETKGGPSAHTRDGTKSLRRGAQEVPTPWSFLSLSFLGLPTHSHKAVLSKVYPNLLKLLLFSDYQRNAARLLKIHMVLEQKAEDLSKSRLYPSEAHITVEVCLVQQQVTPFTPLFP